MRPTPRTDAAEFALPDSNATAVYAYIARILARELAEAMELLEESPCPRPASDAPHDLSVTGCLIRDECGCSIGSFLRRMEQK